MRFNVRFNMPFGAIIALLCTSIALILAFLALFAGTNHDVMEGYDIFLINTSRLGTNLVGSANPGSKMSDQKSRRAGIVSSVTAAADNTVQNATDQAQDVANEVEGHADSLLQTGQAAADGAIRDATEKLGIKDFYSVHVLNHCEGSFKPGTTTRDGVTCTDPSNALSGFNITDILSRKLASGSLHKTLANLKWPDEITNAENDVKMVFNASLVLLSIGIVFTGVALLGCAAGLFVKIMLVALVNAGACWLAFLVLGITSIATTAGANKIVDSINHYGKGISVGAKRGDNYLALIWATTVLMAVAGCAWSMEVAMRRRKMRMSKHG